LNLVTILNENDEIFFDTICRRDEETNNQLALIMLLGSAVSADTTVDEQESTSALEFVLKLQMYFSNYEDKLKTREYLEDDYYNYRDIANAGIDILRRDMEEQGWLK
jgi:hypothetical protein